VTWAYFSVSAIRNCVLPKEDKYSPSEFFNSSGIYATGASILALKRGAKVYLHAFLDGRDTPPRSAQPSLEKLDALFAQYEGK
ncbi:hypothetical protein, partial [Acinetobacter baumannii]|uniref:hypothetical protein n=1 Tax=Acinetobacter baumannii TaxID=470 RepID=UPI001F5591A9